MCLNFRTVYFNFSPLFCKMDSKLFNIDRKIENLGTKDELNSKHTLVWNIPNFMWLLNNQTNREINSQNNVAKAREREDIDTGIADGEETEFQVKIELVGRENDLIEIYYMAYDTMLLKASSHVQYNEKSNFVLIGEERCRLVDKNTWQFLTVQYKRLLAEKCQNILTLKFEFLFAQESENTLPKLVKVEDKKIDVPTMPEIKLEDDLSSLLMNDAYSDVTVKSAEGEEFPAHKAFLGARSPVFRALFDHRDMVENQTNIVECQFEAVVLKELLAFIYTNTVPNIDQFPRKLLEAADYCEIYGLKSLCEPVIAKKLSVENAIETLIFANMYRTVYLKRKTLEFIKDGAAADITETDGWKASKYADVIKSVYECVVKNKIE